jgi:aspartate ammonia-lyase
MISREFRVEHDTLGEIKVPADSLYGAQTQRAVLNFPISYLKPWRAFIWSMAVIKKASASVNNDLGLLDDRICHFVEIAAEEVISGLLDEHFVVDPFQAGAGTSHNMNLNEVIANKATIYMGGKLGEYIVHPNDHVNMSQSTNDTIPTAIRLGCLWRMSEFDQALEHLAAAFANKSIEFDNVIKSGRTHLQDAVPLRLGQEFAAYGHAIEKDSERIRQAANRLKELGIGGTAVGSGLNAHRDYHQMMVEKISELTGIEFRTSLDLFERMQSMADMVDFSSAMRTLAVTLTRIANDLRLLSSGPATGFAEITLPPVQPGSSIMPGKVNPVLAEMVNMAMYHVMGCDTTITLAAQAGQLELNVMMPIIAHNLFEMMQVMIGAINAFTEKCVTGIKANPEKAMYWLSNNAILATVLSPMIGYSASADLVKQAYESEQSIRDTALSMAQQGNLYRQNTTEMVTPQEVETAFSNMRDLTEGGIVNQ